MNVLLIAPETGLTYATDEVAAVASALKAVPLLGHVTVRAVTTMISTKRWDVIWFATHGGPEGVLLSDGAKLSTAQITQELRNSGARLLVLNTCDSVATANAVHEELGIDVVCTIVEVPDVDAFTTASYFARGLGDGLSVADAYARAKPGQNRTYLYLSSDSPHMNQNDNLMALLNQWGKQLSDQMSRIDQRIDKLERRLDTRLDHVEEQAAANVEALKSLKPTRARTLQWLLGFILFCLVGLLLVPEVRYTIGLSIQAAILFAFVLIPLSAYMFLGGLALRI